MIIIISVMMEVLSDLLFGLVGAWRSYGLLSLTKAPYIKATYCEPSQSVHTYIMKQINCYDNFGYLF